MDNREFSQKDKEFRDACSKANVEPTVRQASKFRMKMGKAFKTIFAAGRESRRP